MVQLELVLDNLTGITALSNDGINDFVTTQTGKVYVIQNGQADQVFDVSDKVGALNRSYDERGLLGLGFFRQRGFIYYITSDLEGRLSEFSGDGEIIHQIIPYQGSIHFGGNLLIDSHGYIFLGVGDNGPQKDPNGHAQDLSRPWGKIHRFKIEGRQVIIPIDNPFTTVPQALPSIYAYGFRNIWGMSFGDHGEILAADVGYQTREELNRVRAGGNYGWNIFEGTVETGYHQQSLKVYSPPVFEYPTGHPGGHATSVSAIVGGYLWGNQYICGDYSGVMMLLNARFHLQSALPLPQINGSVPNIRAFGLGIKHLYLITGSGNPYSGSSLYVITL